MIWLSTDFRLYMKQNYPINVMGLEELVMHAHKDGSLWNKQNLVTLGVEDSYPWKSESKGWKDGSG